MTTTVNETTRVTVPVTYLLAAARAARGVIPKRPGLPILGCVRFGGGAVEAFDYETAVSVQVVELDAFPVVAVPGGLLVDALRAMPKRGTVTVALDGQDMVLTGPDGGAFRLPLSPVEDYPILPNVPGAAMFTVPSPVLPALTTAAGRDETLPVLTGVLFAGDGVMVEGAATDRYRLTVATVGASSWDGQVVVRARVLGMVHKLDKRAEWGVAVSPEGFVRFTAGRYGIVTRTLDGAFPKYRTLVPTDFVATVTFGTTALAGAVKGAASVCERNTPIVIEPSDGPVRVRAGSSDAASASWPVPVLDGSLPDRVAYNAAYLMDGLAVLGDTVTLHYGTEPGRRPMVMRSGDVPGVTYLLMPVRLTS